MPHLCKQPGCVVPVEKGHFMCIDHWKGLPPKVQQGLMTRAHGWRKPALAIEFLRDYFRSTGALRGVGCE
jgi:hypothetical protein